MTRPSLAFTGAFTGTFTGAFAAASTLALAAACGAPPEPSAIAFATPQALQACPSAADAMQARLWISGHQAPCFLDVDVDAGTTGGACSVTPGLVRRFTLEWFVDDAGQTVVLAQATRDVDLSRRAEDTLTLTFAESDVKTSPCLDMSDDAFNGSDTVDVRGTPRPVCDLDDDGIANLDEVCAGDDPLGAL